MPSREMSTEINVGVLIAHSPASDVEALQRFADRIARMASEELQRTTRSRWIFDRADPTRLDGDHPRRPSDFLDEASLHMAEGPYDLVVVVTDVAVASRRNRVVYGLASAVSRVAVLSTRKLLLTPRGQPARSLEHDAALWNGAELLVHLIGHMLGARHGSKDGASMSSFTFDPDRRAITSLRFASPGWLSRRAREIPEREHTGGGFAGTLMFHLHSAAINPLEILLPLLRSRALLLPLALPSLATAAVAPSIILVFTAEIWDVGLNMSNRVAIAFALVSILAATAYLTRLQNLFFPRKEKRVITEHMAVVNVSIFLIVLLGSLGLFLMLVLLMLVIEVLIFPPDLIATWPTLQVPHVDLAAKIRLASFISTIGVLTGALAGGLESRTVIRHLALFPDEP
jgi:predicted Zn-dependent protease